MIRIVTTRHWQDVNARAAEAEADLATTREKNAALETELSSSRTELKNARVEMERLRLAWACAEVATLEAGRQVDRLTKTFAEPRTVFVLTHLGELHSAHSTMETAKKAAEDAGAWPTAWQSTPPEKPLCESTWCITGLDLQRGEGA